MRIKHWEVLVPYALQGEASGAGPAEPARSIVGQPRWRSHSLERTATVGEDGNRRK